MPLISNKVFFFTAPATRIEEGEAAFCVEAPDVQTARAALVDDPAAYFDMFEDTGSGSTSWEAEAPEDFTWQNEGRMD